jgi:nitroreductase
MLREILSRRSIRKFTSDALPTGAIEDLLRAAMAAPSAGNEQPWHFLVITDKEKLARIPEAHEFSSMVPNSQACIVVCGEPALAKHGEMWIQDCAAATENILLAAHALGLGAVWLGCYPREYRMTALSKMFSLPDGIIPFSLIPIGLPAEVKPPRNNYDETKVHRQDW